MSAPDPASTPTQAPAASADPRARFSLRSRAAALLLAFTVVPTAALGLGLTWMSHGQARERLAIATTSSANGAARDVETHLRQHVQAVVLIAESPLLKADFTEPVILAALDGLRQNFPGLRTAIATDSAGALVGASPRTDDDGRHGFWRGLSVADRDYFREPMRTKLPFVSDLFRGRADDLVVALSAPVVRDGNVLGLIEGSLDLQALETLHNAVTGVRGFELVVLDRAGAIAFASAGAALEPGSRADAVDALARLLARASNRPSRATVRFDAQRRYIGAHASTAQGWRAIVLAPLSPLYEQVRYAMLAGLALLALAMVTALAVTPLATRAFTRPVRRLAYRIGHAARHPDAEPPPRLPRELLPIWDSFVAARVDLDRSFDALRRTLEREQGLRGELERVLADREAEVERRTRELRVAVGALKDQSETDALTGLANYRRYQQELERLWVEARDAGRPLGALLTDIDHFKAYNDTYGHLAGDECLRRVAATLAATLRGRATLVARSGGEEFVALFASAGRRGLLDAAESARAAIEALALPHTGAPRGHVTASFGVAVLVPTANLQMDALVRGADLALYRSKREGRNRVSEMSPALLQRRRSTDAPDS